MSGKRTICVGGLVVALSAAWMPAIGQSTSPGAQTSQSVPNAPVPQTLPALNTITPVERALPGTAGTSTTEQGADQNGGVTPGQTLPATPAATDQAAQGADQDADQGPPPASTASEANRLSVYVQYHQIPFTVTDSKGHLVPGITWRDVRVYENGLRQHISLFTTDPFPLAVALVIDQSVTFDTMEKINDSLAALQGAFTPYDEISVFTYNNGVTKQTDFTAAQSARLSAILERSKGTGREPVMGLTGPLSQGSMINNQQIDGVADPGHQPGSIELTVPREFHTLNDAILEAAQETSTASRDKRRIVYVISDGKEYGSKASQKEVTRYLLTNNIEVWATQVGDSAIRGMGFVDRMHIPLTMRDDVLPKYTMATGGEFDSEFRPKGIQNSFSHITDEIRAQYTVGYYTHESPYDETYRRTEIRVMRPGLTINAIHGYYPSAADNTRSRPLAPATPSAAAPATTPEAAPAPTPPPATP